MDGKKQIKNKIRNDRPQFEYSPENNHNTSLTTSATAADTIINGGTF